MAATWRIQDEFCKSKRNREEPSSIDRNHSAFGLNEEYHGEFDPGSERTLAARLKHASRAARRSNPP